MTHLLNPPPTVWVCPNCPVTERTAWNVTNRYHVCSGLAGLNSPLVPAGARCTVQAREREDYVGKDTPHYDGNGRPVMAIVTERDDGSNDVVVLAPTVNAKVDI